MKDARKQRGRRQQEPSAVAGALLLALPELLLHVGGRTSPENDSDGAGREGTAAAV